MEKYIDADKLKAEIDRQKIGYNTDGEHAAEYNTCRKILDIIASLQQEQKEVDLNGEITRFLSNATKMNKGEWRGKYPISDIGFRAVAHHFYELGKNNK